MRAAASAAALVSVPATALGLGLGLRRGAPAPEVEQQRVAGEQGERRALADGEGVEVPGPRGAEVPRGRRDVERPAGPRRRVEGDPAAPDEREAARLADLGEAPDARPREYDGRDAEPGLLPLGDADVVRAVGARVNFFVEGRQGGQGPWDEAGIEASHYRGHAR
jgi:hypothetical protein